jgi:hypothetical protein
MSTVSCTLAAEPEVLLCQRAEQGLLILRGIGFGAWIVFL